MTTYKGKYKYNNAWSDWEFFGEEKDGKLTGSGEDNVGKFSISGSINHENNQANFIKQYHGKHLVDYRGKLSQDKNAIEGTWYIGNTSSDFIVYLPLVAKQHQQEEKGDEKKENDGKESISTKDVVIQCKYFQYKWVPFEIVGVDFGGIFRGTGEDVVGKYQVVGVIDRKKGTVEFDKFYIGAHSVYYTGNIQKDGSTVYGKWFIGDYGDKFEMILPPPLNAQHTEFSSEFEHDGEWTLFKFNGLITDECEIIGSGKDDVGPFIINGIVDFVQDRLCYFEKKYMGAHLIIYEGRIEKNNIDINGKWHLKGQQGERFRMKVDENISKRIIKNNKKATTSSFVGGRAGLFGVLARREDDNKKKSVEVTNIIGNIEDKKYVKRLEIAWRKSNKAENILLGAFDNLENIVSFMKCIIHNEHILNSRYALEIKKNHDTAYNQYKKFLEPYEKLPKALNQIEKDDFVGLYFDAAIMLPQDFEDSIEQLKVVMNAQGCKVETSGGKVKRIQRAFYKTYYVYDGDVTKLTDLLRCSLVFDDFFNLYRAVTVLSDYWQQQGYGDILKLKNRFQVDNIPFGYRDLICSVYAPGSNNTIVCELQFHHKFFYDNKEPSHEIYKRARLFEFNEDNLAYNYALLHMQAAVKNELQKFHDAKLKYMDDSGTTYEWSGSKKKH